MALSGNMIWARKFTYQLTLVVKLCVKLTFVRARNVKEIIRQDVTFKFLFESMVLRLDGNSAKTGAKGSFQGSWS